MNSCSEWQITYLFWYLSASVCHVRWCSLCVPFGVFISIQREAHPFLGMSKIKSATPLTAPSYFIRACVPDQLSTNWEAVDPFLKVCWSGVSVSGFFLDWGICPGDIITVICF